MENRVRQVPGTSVPAIGTFPLVQHRINSTDSILLQTGKSYSFFRESLRIL